MRNLLFTGLLLGVSALSAQQDPPSRVARLSFLQGTVSFQAAGQEDWSAASLNYPLTVGDHLWADEQSRAELDLGSAAVRLDDHTALAFLNLDDRVAQMRLSDGSVNLTIRQLDPDESYEIDTPNCAISLLRPGVYRIDSDPDRQVASVAVLSGEAEVTANGTAFPVHARQAGYVTGDQQTSTEVAAPQPPDDFDHWAASRDDRFSRQPPSRYVSPQMVGSEDLDQYGVWTEDPGLGPIWRPRHVEAGWAPYRYGHWAWVEPWGWTWIDDQPWGFAPFHYGRWAYAGGGWGWVPGQVVARPVYAPALVAWVGGSNWGASISLGGGGGGVGWFPLGPREAYVPAYHVSNTYVTRVNVTNVTNVTNITNVTNVRYVNQNVPGAVTAVSQRDFVASRQISRVAVSVPPRAVAEARVSTREVPVSREQAVAMHVPNQAAGVRPPQRIVNTPVVTRMQPPPATRAMARPVATGQINRPPVPNEPNRPGQPVPVNRPQVEQPQANRPGQPQPAYRPPVPNEANRPGQPAPVNRPQVEQPQANRPPQPNEANRPNQPEPANRPPQQQTPAYRPPQPNEPNPANRPNQPAPSYRPPQPNEPNRPNQPQPTYRPPARNEQPNRPQAAEQPHNHGGMPPSAQRKEDRPAERPRGDQRRDNNK